MIRPRLTFDGEKFVLTGVGKSFATRYGFYSFDGSFITRSVELAARLRTHADDPAKNKISQTFISHTPWSGRIPHPKELTPYAFQFTAATFALERNRSYLALDPGLGKTIVSALIINALSCDAVFVVPPFLAINTKYEIEKWARRKREAKILIVPDSMIVDPLGYRQDIWNSIESMGKRGAILFVDEAHRYKTMTAQRTKALHSLGKFFERIIFLSGTPMPNRPMELYATLSRFAPETISFKSLAQYGKRYCAAFYNGHGYDYSGASHVEELASRIHGVFMHRVRKGEVLRELPDKTEELIFLAENAPKAVTDFERRELATHSPEDLMQGKLGAEHTSTYRRLLGVAKTPLAIKFICEILSESDESCLVFATHIEVVERLTHGLRKFNPVVITGKIPRDKRNGLVKEFQTNKKKRVFIGNVDACGVGFTLTKATRVIHVEPSWVPGVNDQASDRAHRIGQKDNVLVQYLVFKNSIDRAVMETNLRKRQTIRHV